MECIFKKLKYIFEIENTEIPGEINLPQYLWKGIKREGFIYKLIKKANFRKSCLIENKIPTIKLKPQIFEKKILKIFNFFLKIFFILKKYFFDLKKYFKNQKTSRNPKIILRKLCDEAWHAKSGD